MFTLGVMLIISGLIELHSALNWKYYERCYAGITEYVTWRKGPGKGADIEQAGDHIKKIGWGFILLSQFEFITMIAALFTAFAATTPYLLPVWVLSFLPRGWKATRAWRVFDNFVCAALFFVAAMVIFVSVTTNVRVG
jgi:hypothetical protein